MECSRLVVRQPCTMKREQMFRVFFHKNQQRTPFFQKTRKPATPHVLPENQKIAQPLFGQAVRKKFSLWTSILGCTCTDGWMDGWMVDTSPSNVLSYFFILKSYNRPCFVSWVNALLHMQNLRPRLEDGRRVFCKDTSRECYCANHRQSRHYANDPFLNETLLLLTSLTTLFASSSIAMLTFSKRVQDACRVKYTVHRLWGR